MAKRNKFEDHPELFIPPVEDKLWQTEGLFSDYYLRAKLNKNDWWPREDEIKSQWESIRSLYNKGKKYLGGKNEALCRQELIHPVLDILGFARIDNQSLPEESTEPDAILFSSQAEKEAVLHKDRDAQYRAAVTLLEAKSFKHPLSQISKSQKRYPHQQIRDYLQTSVVQRWGILSNGHEWRLYCRDTKPKDYFSLDLEIAIQSLEKFKTFVALFSPAAFRCEVPGKCRLDYIKDQALNSQSELEANLRKRVFTILANLANGFAARPENQIADTEESLESLYENCLIYLYRLLFILYAEGRKLLPVESETRKYYKNLSLARLVPSLRNFSDYEDQYLTKLGDSIIDLFHLINGTNARMNRDYKVPRYNGGLFDPNNYQKLEKWKIADADLAEVLRGLMFNPPPDPKKPNMPLQTVDYSDLRVQHLGSIYEGLLEYHLVRTEKGRLELKSDKAERKATGTYYTPDYIVKYIVEQTVKPLLDEIEQSAPVQAADPNFPKDEFAEAVLALNICDPAMGSGHFLVEATIFLAYQIATHPSTLHHTKQAKDEEEIAYWRRRIVESCIYGVDLKSLAVELAKLSLWLTCISSDQPLNFLDHHLRVGNSLIGARLDQLANLPDLKGKTTPKAFGDLFFAADLQNKIAATIAEITRLEKESSDNVEVVKDKERRWAEEILPHLAPYKYIADLWTGAFFGEMSDKQAYIETVHNILKKPKKKYPAHSRYFFHWELEFPAVFFNEDGSPKDNPGFDAVVGNPPWGAAFGEQEKQFNKLAFGSVIVRMVDSFMFFVFKGLTLTRSKGYVSYIVPSPFLLQGDIKFLRKNVLETTLLSLVNLGDGVFGPEVTTPCCIFVLKNASCNLTSHQVHVADITNTPVPLKSSELFNSATFRLVVQNFYLNTHNYALITKGFDTANLIRKTASVSMKLFDVVDGGIQRGISTDYNDAFLVSDEIYRKEKLEFRVCLPVLTGQNISRYLIEWNGERVLYLSHSEEIESFPNIWNHLERFKDKITCKEVLGGKHPWFALHRTRNSEIFKPPKFVGLTTTDRISVALEKDGLMAIDALYVFRLHQQSTISCSFVLSLLNSKLLTFLYRYYSQEEDRVLAQVKADNLYPLPIRNISFITPAHKRSSLLSKAQELYKHAVAEDNSAGILAWVDDQLTAQPERSDVIHDLLAFLAERMIEMNKEKHEAARDFLTDLKDFHRIDAHALKPKTLLDEFWKLETSALFEHFKKNQKTLHAANVKLYDEDENKIRTRFEKSKSSILPLETQIAFTDRLIDQIVYKLYGLTEEEIRLVEGEK